jgi:hypothetical protein
VLKRFVVVVVGLAGAVVVGRTAVRVVAVVGVRDAAVAVVVLLVVLVLAAIVEAGFLSAVDPITLARRSVADVVFVGAREEGVPARDMRFAALEMPFFSSPELATLEDFSSAELLIEARDRWVAVVLTLGGLRTVLVEVVVGRVGGLLNVPPPVEARDVGFVPAVVVEPTVRFVATELVTGRLVVLEVNFFAGDALVFPTSGLVTASDLDSSPDNRAASTGVWGGGISVIVSGPDSEGSSATGSTAGASVAGTSTSSGAVAIGSSVVDMVQ